MINKLIKIFAFIFSFLFILSLSINGQVQTFKIKKIEEPKVNYKDSIRKLKDSLRNARPYYNGTIDIYYGNKCFSNSFYDQLNQTNNFNPDLPIKMVGIGFSNYHFAFNARGSATIQMFFSSYLKNTINISDTIPADIKGFSYHFGIGKVFRNYRKKYSIAAYLGFNTGRLKLIYAEGYKQKNGFFAPKISLQPKVMLTRKISISLIFDYEYDISKAGWKNIKNKKNVFLPNGLDQKGFVGLIALGYCPYNSNR